MQSSEGRVTSFKQNGKIKYIVDNHLVLQKDNGYKYNYHLPWRCCMCFDTAIGSYASYDAYDIAETDIKSVSVCITCNKEFIQSYLIYSKFAYLLPYQEYKQIDWPIRVNIYQTIQKRDGVIAFRRWMARITNSDITRLIILTMLQN